jgi:CRP-like cAMP-binding protein
MAQGSEKRGRSRVVRSAPGRTSVAAAERNRLLLALPRVEYASLLESLEPVPFQLRDILYHPGAVILDAYFPQHGVASVIAVDRAGLGVEVASVGHEGMVGMALYHGVDSSPHECLVQIAGDAKRIGGKALLARLPDLPKLQRLLHRYSAAMFNDAAQTVICNRRHSNEQRCARWLLMTDDSVQGAEFSLTQEFLSYMLAVRRADVSIAAGRLQKDGLIRYSRGVIRVLDRVGLEAAACECYAVTHESHEQVYE